MTENDLLAAVLDLAALLHVHTAHFRPAHTDQGWRTAVSGDGKGFPDLVIVGPGGVLYRELKTEGGRATLDQRRWINWLQDAGEDCRIWKPSDLLSGAIHLQLKGVA